MSKIFFIDDRAKNLFLAPLFSLLLLTLQQLKLEYNDSYFFSLTNTN